MINGRELIRKAANELNDSKILNSIVDVSGIETASEKELSLIINNFLDSVETIPERKEYNIPKYVINAYNAIVDKSVLFDNTSTQGFDIDAIVYKRTKFHD